MKKLTNHASGPRGITLLPEKEGGNAEIVWLDPGATVSVDPKRIVEPLPDLGIEPAASDTETDDLIAAVQAENDDLKKQVDAQAKQITDLTAENEKLKKAAKPA